MTSVEIDSEILKVGREYFGFDPSHDDQIISVEADAYEFILGSQEKFDIILFDINYEEVDGSGVSPPMKYYEEEFLNKLVDSLSDEGGMIAFNSMISDNKARR